MELGTQIRQLLKPRPSACAEALAMTARFSALALDHATTAVAIDRWNSGQGSRCAWNQVWFNATRTMS